MASQQSASQTNFNSQTGSSSSSPWATQQPYLTVAFQDALRNYQNRLNAGPWQGDYIAQDARNNNGMLRNAYQQAFNFGTNQNNLSAAQNAYSNGGAMQSSGMGFANQGMSGLAGLAGDNTSTIIDNASQIANSPYLSEAVRAAMHDAERQAAESTVPNIYRDAAGSNNLNSSRAALSQGVVDRGLAELTGNLSATMRQNMYSQGLGIAQNGIGQQIDANRSLGSLGLQQYASGLAGMQQGLGAQSQLNQMAVAAGQGHLGLAQDNLNNELARYQEWVNGPSNALANYYSLIGANSWGNQSTGSQTGFGMQNGSQQTNPGLASLLGAGIGGISSLLSAPAGGLSTMQGLSNLGRSISRPLFGL